MAVAIANDGKTVLIYTRVDTRKEWRSHYRIMRPRILDGLFEFLRIDGVFVEIPIEPPSPTGIGHDGTRLTNMGVWSTQVPFRAKPLFAQMLRVDDEVSPPEVTLVGSPYRVVGLGFKFDQEVA